VDYYTVTLKQLATIIKLLTEHTANAISTSTPVVMPIPTRRGIMH